MILLTNSLNLETIVVLTAGLAATIMDIRKRIIYRRLTLPVFICGLIYALIPLLDSFCRLSISRVGMMLLAKTVCAWIAPSLLVFGFVLFLFWLGIIGGGDGHFFIAITPWCGLSRMSIIFMYFFPLAFLYLLVYMLIKYRFDMCRLIKDQVKDTIMLGRNIPTIINNIRNGEEAILIKGLPYKSIQIDKPPAMIAVYAAIIISLIQR